MLNTHLVLAQKGLSKSDTKTELFRKYLRAEVNGSIENYRLELKGKYNKNQFKYLNQRLNDVSEHLVNEMNLDHFSDSEDFISFTNKVFDRICKSNDVDCSKYHIVIRKSPFLNAACYPNGIISLNMGLFYYINTEEEFASILAHEISHKELRHWERASFMRYEMENSKEYKQELKTLKNSFARHQHAFALLKDQLYISREQMRRFEFEADSMAVVLLNNAAYNPSSMITMLEYTMDLDSMEISSIAHETYRKLFDISELSFNEKWLAIEDMSAYNYSLYQEKLNSDSLSTHPEILERKERIMTTFQDLNEFVSEEDPAEMKSLKHQALKSIIPNLLVFDAYGTALHACIMFIEDDIESAYHKYWVGICLDKLVESKKNYKFNMYIPQVNPKEQSASVQQFLSFMWNLSIKDLELFANHYRTLYPILPEEEGIN